MLQMAPETMRELAQHVTEILIQRIDRLPGDRVWEGDFKDALAHHLAEDPPETGRPARCGDPGHVADHGRWCADAGRPTRFKPSSPSPTDAVRDGSAKLGHPVQNVTREHGLTPLPR